MAGNSWPNPAVSRAVNDIQYEQLMSAGFGNGIVGGPGQTTVIYGDSSGRQVKVRANKVGYVRGRAWNSGAADYPAVIAANSSGSTRLDLVVLRLYRNSWTADVAVKQGVPGGAVPSLSQDLDLLGAGTNTYEVPLAVVTVGAGVTTINPGDVAARCVYLGYPTDLVFPDLTTLGMWLDVVPGMTVKIGDQRYVYTSGAWRRADWYSAWGLIGGQPYASTGAVLASGLAANTFYTINMNSGLVTFTPGRMCRVEVKTKFVQNTSIAIVTFGAVDNASLAGPVRASESFTAANTGYGYEKTVSGTWNETAGGARTLLATGKTTSNSLDVYRSSSSEQVGVYVYDMGPSSTLAAVI